LKNGTECTIECPPKTFKETIERICEGCHTTCKSCDGKEINNCVTCDISEDSTLKYFD